MVRLRALGLRAGCAADCALGVVREWVDVAARARLGDHGGMQEPSGKTLYRIVSAADWRAAVHEGAFRGTEHDVRDGFIHLSAADQVVATAAKHYGGKSELLLLFVRERLLRELSDSALRWEPSRGGALFPHLYAALPVTLVHHVERLPLDEQGKHLFPTLEP